MSSLTRKLLNNEGLKALTTSDEYNEVRLVQMKMSVPYMTVKLKRTFNQKVLDGSTIRYWRIIGPACHPNLNSDLSIQGLKDWRVIR